mmetsp:Transcript_29165/g.74825  ORF Transcript_29165/g.74825 Transcript_29165/m.74825 type:complete len:215 (-) Transcript_29165:456-1100(-)
MVTPRRVYSCANSFRLASQIFSHFSRESGSPDCSAVTASRDRVLKSSSASKRPLAARYSSMRSDTSMLVESFSFMCWMSMPNCVPQSPMWLRRTTSAPQNSSSLQRVSPRMVERRWPTCISFATLGEEKSTTTRCFTAGAHVLMPFLSMPIMRPVSQASLSLMLMKPGPARLISVMTPFSGTAATMASATARGFLGAPSLPFMRPKSAMALLHW